jgi:1-acyl-sn-glycerol-3-phosphate acyltransferase
MINFMTAINTLLKRGETVLIYPEQEMWWNYKKPRPYKVGAFKIAQRAGVPVVPTFITMQDDPERVDGDGCPVQRHTLHIMPAIYPDGLTAEEMMQKTYEACKEKYEEVYGIPLVYETEEAEK